MTLTQQLNRLLVAFSELAAAEAQRALCCMKIQKDVAQILTSQQQLEKDTLANTLVIQHVQDQQNMVMAAMTDLFQLTKTGFGVDQELLQQVLAILNHQLRTLTLTFYDEQGNKITQENGMPFQLTDGGAGSHLFVVPTETDAAGNPVNVDPTKMTYAVSDPTAFTLTPNATTSPLPSPDAKDASGNPVMIAPGGCEIASVAAAGHLGSFQVTVTDTGNSLNVQDNITVVSGAATVLGVQGTVV